MKETAIHVQNLSKKFKVLKKDPDRSGLRNFFKREYNDLYAVDDISFDIYKGEVVGFIGPNGAGKTTTLKCLSGLLTPDSGKVDVLGFKPHKRKNAFLQDISLVMGQKSQLWWEIPAMDSFLLNKEIYQVSDEDFEYVVNNLVKLLDLQEVVDTQVRKLSLGERMKCEIVSSLLHNPKLLFLDEPTIGLDVVSQHNLRDFFKEYNKRFNTTVLLTSHNMEDVKDLCKRVIVINKGKILFDGKISDLIQKYIDSKYVTVVVRDNVLDYDFEKYGKVVDVDGRVVKLLVKRKGNTGVVSDILKNFDVEDIDIHEPTLEEVVKGIFEKGYMY